MKKDLEDRIKEVIENDYPQILQYYRHLHEHPELSFEERETAEFIESILSREGINFRKKIGGYGILAWIESSINPNSNTIALRADMDALPIEEKNEIPYRSKRKGVMHACGHDSHTASLLATAVILKKFKDEFQGRILFIFQPGEERHPGGASLMLADGIFDQFKPEAIIAQHAYSDYSTGTVGFRGGVIMASADEVHIRIKGKGGHAAIPNELNDVVLAASQVLIAMQQVVSRRSNPIKPMVLSFGKMIAEGSTNVLPEEVVIAGSLRCMDEEQRKKIKPIIREIAIHSAQSHGCDCEIEVYEGYPCTINNDQLNDKMKQFAQAYLGEDKVLELPTRMTSEDFGFFSQQFPSSFYRFGISNQELHGGQHTANFLIDEEALKTSTGLMVYLAMKYCSSNSR